MATKEAMTVDSSVGRAKLDAAGSAVAAVKMDAAQTYIGVPDLLKSVIDESSTEAWQKIKGKIDYIYANLDQALGRLDKETGFGQKVKSQVKAGKKLLFKPNLVNPSNIDPTTHGEGLGNTACTEWPFIAALMRWFHDKLDIAYHEMALGEAASVTSGTAGYYSMAFNGGRRITTEAVMEGKSGDFYGGWGFYFARKYLAETHPTTHKDNPMNGYEESVSGKYLPPGKAGSRLMVYDLNRTYDVRGKGRTVPVPDGANFKEITLHKAIVGGDPADPRDLKDYPGCVLVNVPRLKMHAIDLLTNAIKNLGIGLYPMEANDGKDTRNTRWKYAFPFDLMPGMKTEIPHQVWFPKMADGTGEPVRLKSGRYAVKKTAGMPGTQADVIKATLNQGIFMLHVVDAIQAMNVSHTGDSMAIKVNEGYAFASLDPVALDVFCARYCLKTVPMAEARKLKKERRLPGDFLQRVPVPRVEGPNIVNGEGFDSPFWRYNLFAYCEKRGLGQQKYYVTGWDATKGVPMASVDGHLGRVEAGKFSELSTGTLYYNPANLMWCLQQTVFAYLDANDRLTGSSYRKEAMDAFDENGDGVIDYDEMGKKGFWHHAMRLGASSMHIRGAEKYGFLRGAFVSRSLNMKFGNEAWNTEKHDFMKEYRTIAAVSVAFRMSQMEMESPDFFFPTMTWGKGKWPSVQFASYIGMAMSIYGMGFPMRVDLLSLYGHAFQYADKTLNGASYTGSRGPVSDLEAANRYIDAVSQGAKPMNFVLYVPSGFGTMAGRSVPNVEETDDPAKVFTARFNNGREVW